MDTLTKERRSWTMSLVKSKNTKPEILVRSFLHRYGFRFRLHRNDLPGHPDIVLPKYQTVIEVRGCFWHQHPGCKAARIPKSHEAFWRDKFARNVKRDKRTEKLLKKLGWHLIVIWECELKKNGFLETIPDKIRDRKSSRRR